MSNELLITAINEVLIAEKENRAEIDGCKQHADEIIEQSRMLARKISDRADERISIVQARADLSVQARIAGIKQEMASLPSQPVLTEQDLDKLHIAVSELVKELVGDG